MYDISTSTEIQITTNESGKADPAIYGDRIVWVDTRNGGIENTDIYMYDLSTFKETQISTNNSQELSPEIYGNRIVWVDTHNWYPKSDIYMCTISGESPAPKPPVADFTCNTTRGYAPLVIQFTDLSQFATSRTWDFENDGKVDSTNKTEDHVYTIPGNYTVKLTAINKNGTDSESTTIKVIKKSQAILPVANFSANVTSGYAPLAVQFTDLSQNSTGRAWDFNNDRNSDSGEVAPVYVFMSPGSYNVNLIATNENGTATKTATINVLKKSSGGSSSGGSSGGGGSPEPARNVEIKEISQEFITNGKEIKFDFAKNATCVVYVSFNAKKTFGKTIAIVEMLKGKSTLVTKLPESEIYKFFNIWVGNSGFATSKNIENPVVCFKVEKTWVNEKNIDQASITLNRYSEKKWTQFSPSLLGEDNKFLYFTAKVSGFSPFAITGKSKETLENATKIEPEFETGIINTNDTGSKEPEIKQGTEKKESQSMPGYRMVYGVIGLLTVFLYKKGKGL
jgi:PGF-pre-PGF domain-containing protein